MVVVVFCFPLFLLLLCSLCFLFLLTYLYQVFFLLSQNCCCLLLPLASPAALFTSSLFLVPLNPRDTRWSPMRAPSPTDWFGFGPCPGGYTGPTLVLDNGSDNGRCHFYIMRCFTCTRCRLFLDTARRYGWG
uniref:Uncharacterized protein n=1 Tax=Cacopsylla melanoneura TaxID=428564 RepID=A0A8D9FI18_9HEMI